MTLYEFSEVPVMPVTQVRNHIASGGPIWPDFARQTGPRHCRNGRPVDTRPARVEPLEKLRRPAIWGGFLDPAFGHLVAEQLTRLPLALAARPKDLVLFTVDPKSNAEALPVWMWEVLEWLGVSRRSVRLVTVPRSAPELRVAPQGEMLGSVPPDPAYLDRLDSLPGRHALDTAPRLPIVYVSRAGIAATGRGAHLGEAYLAGLLTRLGVTVIDPGQMPIREQMQAYALADVLIFSEGSALHGRQLLGRLGQDIHVLTRRPGSELAREQLAPRCRTLAFHDVSAGLLTVTGTMRHPQPRAIELHHLTASFYAVEPLLRVFADLGVPLARLWAADAYREAALADALRWLVAQNLPARQTLPNLLRILEQTSALDELPAPSAPLKAGTALH